MQRTLRLLVATVVLAVSTSSAFAWGGSHGGGAYRAQPQMNRSSYQGQNQSRLSGRSYAQMPGMNRMTQNGANGGAHYAGNTGNYGQRPQQGGYAQQGRPQQYDQQQQHYGQAQNYQPESGNGQRFGQQQYGQQQYGRPQQGGYDRRDDQYGQPHYANYQRDDRRQDWQHQDSMNRDGRDQRWNQYRHDREEAQNQGNPNSGYGSSTGGNGGGIALNVSYQGGNTSTPSDGQEGGGDQQ